MKTAAKFRLQGRVVGDNKATQRVVNFQQIQGPDAQTHQRLVQGRGVEAMVDPSLTPPFLHRPSLPPCKVEIFHAPVRPSAGAPIVWGGTPHFLLVEPPVE